MEGHIWLLHGSKRPAVVEGAAACICTAAARCNSSARCTQLHHLHLASLSLQLAGLAFGGAPGGCHSLLPATRPGCIHPDVKEGLGRQRLALRVQDSPFEHLKHREKLFCHLIVYMNPSSTILSFHLLLWATVAAALLAETLQQLAGSLAGHWRCTTETKQACCGFW